MRVQSLKRRRDVGIRQLGTIPANDCNFSIAHFGELVDRSFQVSAEGSRFLNVAGNLALASKLSRCLCRSEKMDVGVLEWACHKRQTQQPSTRARPTPDGQIELNRSGKYQDRARSCPLRLCIHGRHNFRLNFAIVTSCRPVRQYLKVGMVGMATFSPTGRPLPHDQNSHFR